MLSYLKKFFYFDVTPLIKLGKTRVLVESDMLSLPSELNALKAKVDHRDLNFATPRSFLFSSIKFTRGNIYEAYIWYFISTLLSLSSPLLIHRFINLIKLGVTEANFIEVLMTGVALALCGLGSGLFLQQFFVKALAAYQQMTNVLNEYIFKHSLKLSLKARSKNLVGDIVNYMGTDAESVADFTFVFADLAMNSLLAIGALVMLFYYIGLSAISALFVMLLMVPLTKKIAQKFIHLEDEMMSLRDQRVTMMGQILNSIRVVKYFAFESSVEDEVMKIRNVELATRIRLAKSQVVSGMTYTATSTFVLFIALYVHSLRGYELDAALIFTCVSLFGILEGPIGELSHHLSRVTNAFVGARRILNYLNEEEVSAPANSFADGIEFINVSASYDEQLPNVLSNISFQLKKGESLAIVGEVGAGKSSLLYSILGEIPLKSGAIKFDRRLKISYLPQEAYIINDSLKNNILFGETVPTDKFENALYYSALSFDVLKFDGGIETEIGEKGVNLSGGQKQRVGLARAYLYDPDILLLDDPLSAVDHNTENFLVDKLIMGAFKDKTRIVVTHRLSHLKRFDKILFLKNGQQVSFGIYLDVLKNHEFQNFYRNHEEEEEKTIEDTGQVPKSEAQVLPLEKSSRITSDEDREVGAVKKDVYWGYIESLGGDHPKKRIYIIALLVFGAIVIAFLPLLQKSWLSYFSNHPQLMSSQKAILIYGLIGIVVLFLNMCNSFLWLYRGVAASRLLHDKMLKSILNASIYFFDSTPVGRILQRFSRDVESVDVYLQWSFISVINCILQVIVSLVLIVSVMPILIIFILPLLIVYYFFQKDYRISAREAKRFDSISRSPRYAHFKETLMGLLVIRSFKKQDYFIREFYKRLIESQRMFYSHYMLNRWFSSRIPIIGGLISLMCAIGITIFAKNQMISPGVAGLVIIYSLSFWGYLNWGVRVFADIESRMTSVERLKYFANVKPEESPDFTSPVDLSHWPLRGEIVAKNIQVRYAPQLPLVLKGISFHIKPGSKVGIMGRTGSGKSTIFQTLFRFIELEAGEIIIDGIDIKMIPLRVLRKSMAIIPQDPTLFMGTIRSNLDRYHEYSDAEINRVLKLTGLYDFIYSLPKNIDEAVNEMGSNLSQGQRQLICLARALLYQTKIIVMDEATASVDVMTDNLIQKVIREDLKNVTLIIIAHRLGTIKDCDQIIEISEGKIVE